jgi:AcrR family transcriptional regulator
MMANRMPSARRPASETREHVLAVAHDLFYADGIRQTGVDRIVAAAGIGPTTLYRLFGSKDGLVTAYVEREAAAYRQWMSGVIEGATPRDGLRAFMRGVADQVEGSHCRGCPFQLALAEIPDPAHPAHRAAVALKRQVRDALRDLAVRARAADPEATGDQLMLLAEGSYAAGRSLDSAAISARAVGAALACLPA